MDLASDSKYIIEPTKVDSKYIIERIVQGNKCQNKAWVAIDAKHVV